MPRRTLPACSYGIVSRLCRRLRHLAWGVAAQAREAHLSLREHVSGRTIWWICRFDVALMANAKLPSAERDRARLPGASGWVQRPCVRGIVRSGCCDVIWRRRMQPIALSGETLPLCG